MEYLSGYMVLFGFAAGALWGWHFATERDSKRLEFWRDQAARLQGETEGMIKGLAEAEAALVAAKAREEERVAYRDKSLQSLHEHVEVLESRLHHAESKAKAKTPTVRKTKEG